MLDASGETFGSWEEEVVWERFVVFVGERGGGEALRRSEAGGFREGDEPCENEN